MVKHPLLKIIPCDRAQNDIDMILQCWETGDCAVPVSNKIPKVQRAQLEDQYHNQPAPHANAYTMIFSSGSTGTPKPIIHSKQQAQAAAKGSCNANHVTSKSKMLLSLPLFHVSGLSILLRSRYAGASLYAYNTSKTLSEQLAAYHITHASVVIPQLRELVDSRLDLSNLQSLLVGGSAIPKPLIQMALKKQLPIQTTYGLSEMGGQVTTSALMPLNNADKGSGNVLTERNLRIDSENRIWVSGPCLALNAITENGWYNTSDLGKWENEQLIVLGRADDMIISGGENIFPSQIEACIMEVADVLACRVISVKNAAYGERPIAFVKIKENYIQNQKKENHNPLPLQLINEIKGNITKVCPSYMVPDAFFPYPEHNAGIKPSRNELREILRHFIPK
ncbi:MAG: AMP-binding protein [bacterium]|nr:AMP-binding protein [bacterium]